jgi:adenosylhomocysteinase
VNGRNIIILLKVVGKSWTTGHPSFVMSNSFTNQTLAQLELLMNRDAYKSKGLYITKILDEKNWQKKLHLEKNRC